jgi:hypothetical protein
LAGFSSSQKKTVTSLSGLITVFVFFGFAVLSHYRPLPDAGNKTDDEKNTKKENVDDNVIHLLFNLFKLRAL